MSVSSDKYLWEIIGEGCHPREDRYVRIIVITLRNETQHNNHNSGLQYLKVTAKIIKLYKSSNFYYV